jgi:signal transduction histidine kinase
VVFAIEAGEVVVDVEHTELRECVEQCLGRFEPYTGRHSFITDNGDAEWPSLLADRAHLLRILRNLVLNALRCSPDGGDVAVEVRTEGGFAVVTVRDEGCGFTAEQLEVLYERRGIELIAGDAAQRSTGLELYKVRRLVELQGGTVSAESRRGEGAALTFTLPLVPSA